MKCDDPGCTGNHNDRKWDTLCPRTRESKREAERRRYDRMTQRELNADLLRTRRLRGLQRKAVRQNQPLHAAEDSPT